MRGASCLSLASSEGDCLDQASLVTRAGLRKLVWSGHQSFAELCATGRLTTSVHTQSFFSSAVGIAQQTSCNGTSNSPVIGCKHVHPLCTWLT